MEFPQYDNLYAISDIHMGGETGFQILRETERLANFITWIGKEHPEQSVALVLNGDVIDTLAESELNGYIAIDNAVSVVKRIMEDPAFKGIWKALKGFVKNKDHNLVFILGNHDIELALPPVQRCILDFLVGNRSEIRSRIEFSTIGAGYTCEVGGSKIFLTHGNEVDAWNYVRYEDLSKLARRLNSGRGMTASEWQPNAGTKMVIDVMNDVKKTYKWIDLLKPEANAAAGVLLALDPGQLGKISKLPGIIGKQVQGQLEADKRLSGDGFQQADQEAAQNINLDQLLGSNVRQSLKSSSTNRNQSVDELLLATEDSYNQPQTDTPPPEDMLGSGQLIWDKLTGWFTGVGEVEALRLALKDWLDNDKTFELDNEDETFTEVTKAIGSNIDFVITGHTHLQRAIKIKDGGQYFNCGTWIRLLKFSDQMLADETSFQPIYDILKDGSMAAIDNAENLVLDCTSTVYITKTDDGKAIGQLAEVKGGTGEIEITLEYK